MDPQGKNFAMEQAKAQEEVLKKYKNRVGRKTVITDEVVVKLITAFQNGLDVKTACNFAGIHRDTYYAKLKSDIAFSDTMEEARDNLKILAGTKITKILRNGSDRDSGPLAWKIFERRIPELYGQPTDKPNGPTTNNYFIAVADLARLFRRTDTQPIDSQKLSEVLETQPESDIGGEKETSTSIHRDQIQNLNSDPIDMS